MYFIFFQRAVIHLLYFDDPIPYSTFVAYFYLMEFKNTQISDYKCLNWRKNKN